VGFLSKVGDKLKQAANYVDEQSHKVAVALVGEKAADRISNPKSASDVVFGAAKGFEQGVKYGSLIGSAVIKTPSSSAPKAAAGSAAGNLIPTKPITGGLPPPKPDEKMGLFGDLLNQGVSVIKTGLSTQTGQKLAGDLVKGALQGGLSLASPKPSSSTGNNALSANNFLPIPQPGSTSSGLTPIKQSLVFGDQPTPKTADGNSAKPVDIVVYIIGGIILVVLLFFGFGKRRR
jgi:hypothetical protein